MPLPPIGSLSQAGLAGRPGVVVGAQPVGEPRDGRQLVALKIKREESQGSPKAPAATAAGPAQGQATRPLSGAPLLASQSSSIGSAAAAKGHQDLSAEERAAVDRLRQRDQQVRQEEEAHAAVAGDLAGPISYVYQQGPDGRRYAVGGSVPIRSQVTSGDPAEARQLGARMAAAAHAATNPSGADLAAARQGYGLQGQAAETLRDRDRSLSITA